MVVNRRLVDAHLMDLDRNVALLEKERAASLEELKNDPVRSYGVQHLLQISIEALANIANHLTMELGLATPHSYVETLENLARGGIVRRPELIQSLSAMARFRNLVVHRYWEVDMARVYEILQNHLEDFREAARDVQGFMADHPEI